VDFQIRIAEAVLAEFADILAYSWANFPAAAERFGNSILNHIDLLKRFPYIGSPVRGRSGHTPILIYYRVHESPDFVEILHIRHGAKGNTSLL
jgi:plasmid stabilization system protein ParE